MQLENVLIRKIIESDLPYIYSIETRGHFVPWSKDIFLDCLRVGYECWLVEENHNIVAFAVMAIGAGEGHLLNLCVDPIKHRQGFGKVLLHFLLRLAKRKAVEQIILEVRQSNDPAIKLYEQCGFNAIGVRKNYYKATNGREDAIMLALDLSSYDD